MTNTQCNSTDPHPRRRVAVLDTEMSYVETGRGDPIVFLHGNPTSSYLWRNIIPYLSQHGRCLAPDLLGMGQSGNYMEAIAMPMRWEDFGEAAGVFRALRSEAGETMIMEQNAFVETILPQGILRKLTGEEMDSYRAPFLEREARLPNLVWPRQIPVEGEPADVTAIVEEYGRAMTRSSLPKLLIAGDPGLVIKGRILEFCQTWRNQTEVTVKGLHFLQEDSPDEIGRALQGFVKSVR